MDEVERRQMTEHDEIALVARLGMRTTEQSHAGSDGDVAASSHQL
jgi:hypothetical protein